MDTRGQIEDDDFLTSGSGQSSKPTIVLVHGALEDASIWSRVIPLLQRDGFPVICFANPLLGLAVTLPTCVACWTGSRAP
jgi:pimeloyl-ACP methyl ester carboxylesterase